MLVEKNVQSRHLIFKKVPEFQTNFTQPPFSLPPRKIPELLVQSLRGHV